MTERDTDHHFIARAEVERMIEQTLNSVSPYELMTKYSLSYDSALDLQDLIADLYHKKRKERYRNAK